MKLKGSIFILVISIATNCSSSTREDFDSFFDNFSTNREFQFQRITFPLDYLTWSDPGDPASEIEARKIESADWKHDYFFMNETYRAQLYDDFEGELDDTDERLFRWIGVENGIDVKYFFKRIKGKWYLIKKEDFRD